MAGIAWFLVGLIAGVPVGAVGMFWALWWLKPQPECCHGSEADR